MFYFAFAKEEICSILGINGTTFTEEVPYE